MTKKQKVKPARVRQYGRTHHQMEAARRKIISEIAAGATPAEACKTAGVAHGQYYTWRANDAVFAWEVNNALAAGALVYEKEAERRAVDGTKKPVFHQGRQVYWVNPETGEPEPYYETVKSDTLLMFLLKSRDPERFDDGTRKESFARIVEKALAKIEGEAGDAGAEAIAKVRDLLAQIEAGKAAP